MNPKHEPDEDEEITYPETREEQAEFQALLDEKGGDWQEAVNAKREGDDPDEPRPNAAMP